MSSVNKKRFEDPTEQAAYEQGMKHGETVGRFLGLAIKKDLENQDLSRQNREQRYLATHDPLTGALNRLGLEEYLSETNITNRLILFADGTNIKEINDNQGHDAGDQAIIALAEILKRSLRKVDVIARTGGDEFVAILSPISTHRGFMPPEEQAVMVENRINKEKEGFVEANPKSDVAVGVAVGQPGLDFAALQAIAEQRMEANKSVQHSQIGAYR